ncbi:RagB/SusD family nutrient uptake outer membrane protein [Salinimicrobium tongyeongense]|uniref:RagB/SusD family nutrient uptake outer membrane protein n=1 Tax=Salinimicrobium tongyeongense TaxID=2809707 RepID=A0ABY6NS90_9FLAO|nr:RagB/SusD family nutrient uptake outer membrane protein [Salinimicrobium tongyeongense]UZH55426.1 RagB/SusD family nutrient uptake outer membrane protein [Salinimicrobium tongyeongense]
MKKINKITAISLFAFLFSFSGCTTDILDQEPVSITHPDVFWNSQSNAEQALAGAYGLFKNTITYQANFLYWGEFPAMTFMNSRNWVTDYIEGSGNYVMAYRDESRNWKNFYRAANWAFTIEEYVQDMPEDLFTSPAEKERIIGEAAFIRSISYFWMARIWGDVPIVEESIESSDQLISPDGYITKIPRSDELEVLDFALKAVNKSIDLLDYSSPGDPTWAITANKASAEALKAHITLWYASRDNGNSEMIQQSIDAATSVINNSNAELIDYIAEEEDGFESMILGQSKTGLFEINISAAMNESFRMSTSDATHTGLTLNYPVFQNLNNGVAPFMDPIFYGNEMMSQNPDRENDVRKELFFYEYANPDDSFLMKYAMSEQDPDSEDVYAQFSESNILLMRLAGIYLLRAEAYAKQGSTQLALDDLNLVRSKAGVPAYTGPTDESSLIKAIFDERAIEFVGEGQSAYDRIRMNYYEGVPWMNQSRLEKEGYFWPIHPSIISINPSIVQNEFWQGKV